MRSFVDGNLWRVDVGPPGNEARPVPAIASTRGDFIPSVSPDGRRIAFLSDRSGDSQVWVSDPGGGNAVQLTTMQFSSGPGFPQWSPDAKTIAFHGDPHGRPDVIVVPAAVRRAARADREPSQWRVSALLARTGTARCGDCRSPAAAR